MENESREFYGPTYRRTSEMNDDKVEGMERPCRFCGVITGYATTVVQTDIRQPNGLKMISTMQLKKDLTRDEQMFMAIPLDSLENPGETFAQVFATSKDDYIDHEIELLSGVKPPTKNAYHMQSGYYQVRIVEADEPKTTCVTKYGAFEFLVMSFGLTNAPATFCTLKSQVFHEYLDKFVVVYLDDVVVYSLTLEEHRTTFKRDSPNECQAAFEGLKQAMMEGPVLGITDMTKPFEVEMDASDYVVFSYKMDTKSHMKVEANAAKKRRTTVQPATSLPSQTMCMLAHLQTSKIDGSVRDVLREFLHKDHATQNFMNLAKAGKIRQFWVDEDLLVTKGNRLNDPRVGDLRKKLLHECHDTLWDKVERAKLSGLLDTLPVPIRPWESISMDFITYLQKLFFKHVVKLWGVPTSIVSGKDGRFVAFF
ncbi:polyprotein [Cucumis melo var. makuwa]|uniref:Polyprotein n=1 Tax=Cucumis melo var. makuwa TaxID=1194695 RepID=A0A5A7TF22_CUCMM|nr:polyprotein [Cucumis melo var. makuwa]TYK17970.1 polyprotein [Cucumis melo var. makuwa]